MLPLLFGAPSDPVKPVAWAAAGMSHRDHHELLIHLERQHVGEASQHATSDLQLRRHSREELPHERCLRGLRRCTGGLVEEPVAKFRVPLVVPESVCLKLVESLGVDS